jgi:DNA-binding MarR family transcriptional regulator
MADSVEGTLRATRRADGGAKEGDRPKPHELLVSYKVITLATLLRRSASLVYRRKLGLSQIDWTIIALVGEHAPLSLNDLSERMGLDKGQLSRGVAGLVRRGFLNRGRRREQRGIQITLTPRGIRAYEKLIEIALERNREMLARLSNRERQTLFKALAALSDVAREILRREQES